MGISEIVLLAIPLFAGLVIVMEDKRTRSEKQ